MLYGVRRDLQDQLVREGYRMRVYVPFGTQWYPYLMRRLAERPANVAFLTGNVLKEMVGKRRRQTTWADSFPPIIRRATRTRSAATWPCTRGRRRSREATARPTASRSSPMRAATGDRPSRAYLLFVRWRQGDPVASGHLETDFLAFADTEDEARKLVGAMLLERSEGAPRRSHQGQAIRAAAVVGCDAPGG